MTFLNPALLIGLAAASIPVIIHLLNLRKLKKIEFSTLSFLKELQKNKIRRIKLKQWILLALRIMIILLIVTAFARPTLEGVSIGGTTSAAKTTAVFILDDSFSMSVVDQNGSYFNQAKQTIKNLLSNLEEGDECGLILVSGDPAGEIQKPASIKAVDDMLNDVKISSASGTLNSALIRAAKIISESKNFNKEIYLLTDFQKDRIAVEQNITDLSEVLDERVKLYSFDYSGKEVNNISIDKLDVATKIFELSKPVTFNVTVSNHSKQAAVNLVVSLFIGGNRSAQKSIDLSPFESKIVQLDGFAQTNGYMDVTVEIEDDEISDDNKRYTAIFIPEKISVLLLYNELSDAKFVKLALQAININNNLGIAEKLLHNINSLRLKNYDAVICIGNIDQEDSGNLNNYIADGGGLIIFPPSDSDLKGYRQTLGLLSLPQPGEIITIQDKTGASAGFEKIDKEHPLLQNIFKDEQKIEIESPAIKKYLRILPMGKGNSIITLVDGSSFLSEYKQGNGKAFIFNVSPVLEGSDFPLKSIFAPLIYKSVLYLSAKSRGGAEYTAGEPLNINISKRTLPLVKVNRPDKSEDVINLNDTDTDFLSYNKTFIHGNYKFYSGDDILETASVNVDPVESAADYISEDQFDEYLDKINFKGSYFRISIQEDPSTVILQARFGSELWRYFLMAAFVLALIEMMIARSAKKDTVEIEQ